MADKWRFSDWDVHVFYVAIYENQQNSRLQTYAGVSSISIWLETFKSGMPVVVHSEETDRDFFQELVEQEFLRLARFDEGEHLPCGCDAIKHRKVLQRFRLKNLQP